jgi:hypothetical protein
MHLHISVGLSACLVLDSELPGNTVIATRYKLSAELGLIGDMYVVL